MFGLVGLRRSKQCGLGKQWLWFSQAVAQVVSTRFPSLGHILHSKCAHSSNDDSLATPIYAWQFIHPKAVNGFWGGSSSPPVTLPHSGFFHPI